MIARYNSEGEFTHFEHPEDQQFNGLDRSAYQEECEEYDY